MLGLTSHLPALEDEMTSSSMDELPQILPHFFVPRLADRPQNPIMDALRIAASSKSNHIESLPSELAALAVDFATFTSPPKINTLWADAMTRKVGTRSQTLSWDALRLSQPSRTSSSAFLSEQGSLVFAAARYHVQPPLRDPAVDVIYVTQYQLLKSLKLTVLGTSSALHAWDPESETFVQPGIEEGRRGLILVDGKDEVISESIIRQFLTIGTLLRRLESLLASLRARSAREGPTIHAFAHALSTILVFLRDSLARCPPSDDPLSIEHCTLSTVWMRYGPFEDILLALSTLYGREESKSPRDYIPLDSSPAPLLSRIYNHLDTHFEWQSPQVITAIFAFILTSASREYFQQVSRTVGFSDEPSYHASHVVGERNDQYSTGLLEDDDVENRDEVLDVGDIFEKDFPDFFPPGLVEVLSAAQKSLGLLRAVMHADTEPGYPLLKTPLPHGVVKWLWTHAEVDAAWNDDSKGHSDVVAQDTPLPLQTELTPPSKSYNADLAQFQIFDLEPGSHFGQSPSDRRFTATSTLSLQAFITAFPESLPSITPTLSHLTSLIFAPLVRHASSLSSTLLSLFLSQSSNLNFQAHLELLRSYLLLTSHSFKTRLAAALFSDAEDCDHDGQSTRMSIRSLHRNPHRNPREPAHQWAVGLAPTLTERETWPPVGADLSFFLRTVIVDSLEPSRKEVREGALQSNRDRLLEEAEFRLGFAIRDLPAGTGREKWLSPLSIEALDFLYMDYKPPHPLEVLITSEILSKYQRVFAFILRIMRVESALSALFRMTRWSSKPLFPTLTSSNKLLMHFRFIAQSFVSNLSEYVSDTAIGGNFDAFLSRLSPAHPPATSGFSDVFSLARSHSAVLDDILSACLLRSGQRGVGDLLRRSLELVLELSILAGELKRGRLEEYQAAPLLEDLFQKFRSKMITLTKVLNGLVEKGPASSRIPLDSGGERRPTGGTDSLHHLLIRLDIGDWWSNARK